MISQYCLVYAAFSRDTDGVFHLSFECPAYITRQSLYSDLEQCQS